MNDIDGNLRANILDVAICKNKGIRVGDSLQDVAYVLHKEYGIISQAAWLPNTSEYCVILRSIYYKPKDMMPNSTKITDNLNKCRRLFKSFDDSDYYTVLRTAILSAELYILKVMYQTTNDEIYLKVLNTFDAYKFVDNLDVCFELDIKSNLKNIINININHNNGNGSIHDYFENFIKILEA